MEIEELRAQIEQFGRQERGEAGQEGQEGQGEPARRESGLEEGWNMDVEEEAVNRKKLDEQRSRQLRDLDKLRVCRRTLKPGSKRRGSKSCRT